MLRNLSRRLDKVSKEIGFKEEATERDERIATYLSLVPTEELEQCIDYMKAKNSTVLDVQEMAQEGIFSAETMAALEEFKSRLPQEYADEL